MWDGFGRNWEIRKRSRSSRRSGAPDTRAAAVRRKNGDIFGLRGIFLPGGVSAYRRRERKLKELTLYLLKLQDGAELPPFESFEEGQLGVLQSEIYKMVSLLDEETKKSKRQNLADMLSDISHQIKTPLAGITLMTDLLKDPELPEEKRERNLWKK